MEICGWSDAFAAENTDEKEEKKILTTISKRSIQIREVMVYYEYVEVPKPKGLNLQSERRKRTMKDICETYMQLRRDAFQSYWETRILEELSYLFELYSKEDTAEWALLEEAVAVLAEDYDENRQIQSKAAKEAERILTPLSEKAKSLSLTFVAHAHIDMNWMWGYQETVSLTVDTMRTMLTLMEEYPDFTFAQSQASVYRILEEYAPELLEQVKERVKEGRWEVTASAWVENDKNLSGGESLARHLLYTKRYLSKLLDIEEDTLNMDFEPDTFGHSGNLPEILNKGGVKRYYHCRGYEGENIYRWIGKSGAEILAYREPGWYNGGIHTGISKALPDFCKKYGITKKLYVYGVGDHGGGPSRRDIELILDMSTWPLFPTLSFGTFREYYDYLEERKEQFPVVEQELNYIFTGCYTSQSRIKMANRIGESRLIESEILESMAKLAVPDYRRAKNPEEAWRKILFNQFHDILPGSGTVDTREYALGEFQKAVARAGINGTHAMDAVCGYIADKSPEQPPKDTAMGAGVGKGTGWGSGYGFPVTERGGGAVRYIALFNVVQTPRTEAVELVLWDWKELPENTRIMDLNGKEYPFQVLERGQSVKYWGHYYCRILIWMPVPAAGYTICRVEKKSDEICYPFEPDEPRENDITDEPVCLENDKVKAIFDVTTMKCISFIRKADGKELIVPWKPACGFTLTTEESSDGMSAWKVGRTASQVDLNREGRIWLRKIETKGLRKELEYELLGYDQNIQVSIFLDEGSEYLDYRIKAIWTMLGSREKGVPQLRFHVPCGYEAENYRYAVPCGIIERPAIAHDVPAIGLGCAVSKTGGSGLCVMSDRKYGFRGDKEGLSLNLIRSSFEPDPYPETGEHMVRIAVGACDTDEENLALMSERFIHPVITRSCAVRPADKNVGGSLLRIDGAVVSAIKEAEDGEGLIVRVYNPSGVEKTMELSLPGKRMDAYLCDILEHNIRKASFTQEGAISHTLGKYEVCTFRIIPK